MKEFLDSLSQLGTIERSADDSTVKVHTIVFGQIFLRLRGPDFVCMEGAEELVKFAKRDFVCTQIEHGILLERSFLPEFVAWLEQAPSSTPEISRRKRDLERRMRIMTSSDTTEVEAQVMLRVGQDLLRKELLAGRGKCEISGVQEKTLLVASHIKSWSKSDSDERLDLENVLLLAANWDALFDKLYISFEPETGRMIKSRRIDETTLAKFGVPVNWSESVRVDVTGTRRRKYLRWHNAKMSEEDQKSQNGCAVP